MVDFLKNKLLILPHQDDELFCYKQLGRGVTLVIVFKGGGEPKGYTLDPEELYKIRCKETLKTCKSVGIQGVKFLGIQRPYSRELLDTTIKEFLSYNSFDIIFTTMVEDKHPDHKALSKAVLKYSKKPTYGFIVQTDALINYSRYNIPDIEIKLTDDEYLHKVKSANNYFTQKHFLPSVIKRSAYKTEKYWRLPCG